MAFWGLAKDEGRQQRYWKHGIDRRGIARESSDAQHLALNGHASGYGCAVLDTGRGSPDLKIKERLPVC